MPKPRRRSLLPLATLLALTFLASESRSQVPEIVGQPRLGLIQDWLSWLNFADKRLQEADHRKARDIADKLIWEMLDRINGGEEAEVGALLGRTLLIRALGEAGLGRSQEATWDWFAARAVQPSLTEAELAGHGPAGAALSAMIARAPEIPTIEEREAQKRQVEADQKAGLSSEKVKRPIRKRGENPLYPKALRSVCTEGTVLLESVIDKAGNLNRPQLVESPSPLLTIAAMEAWRTWRFKPATLEGKAVTVYYTLTINFKLPACKNAAAVAKQKKE